MGAWPSDPQAFAPGSGVKARAADPRKPAIRGVLVAMNIVTSDGQLRTVIPAEQIQKRVREMGRQISDDYRGRTIHVLGLLENGFIFMADLVRALEVPVICQFIKPQYRPGDVLEIFFSH